MVSLPNLLNMNSKQHVSLTCIIAELFCGFVVKVWFQKQYESKRSQKACEVSSKTRNGNKDE